MLFGPVRDALPFKDLRTLLLSLMPLDSRRGQSKVLHAGVGDSEPRSAATKITEVFPDFGFHICQAAERATSPMACGAMASADWLQSEERFVHAPVVPYIPLRKHPQHRFQ